eukprot:1157935-Pelagomonas_calceolata.AAC.26
MGSYGERQKKVAHMLLKGGHYLRAKGLRAKGLFINTHWLTVPAEHVLQLSTLHIPVHSPNYSPQTASSCLSCPSLLIHSDPPQPIRLNLPHLNLLHFSLPYLIYPPVQPASFSSAVPMYAVDGVRSYTIYVVAIDRKRGDLGSEDLGMEVWCADTGMSLLACGRANKKFRKLYFLLKKHRSGGRSERITSTFELLPPSEYYSQADLFVLMARINFLRLTNSGDPGAVLNGYKELNGEERAGLKYVISLGAKFLAT